MPKTTAKIVKTKKTRKTRNHLNKTKRKTPKAVLASMFKLKTLKSKKNFTSKKETSVTVRSLDIINQTIVLINKNIDAVESMMLSEKNENATISYLQQFIPRLEKTAKKITTGEIRLTNPSDVEHAMKDVLAVTKYLIDMKDAGAPAGSNANMNNIIRKLKGTSVNNSLDEIDELLGKLKM